MNTANTMTQMIAMTPMPVNEHRSPSRSLLALHTAASEGALRHEQDWDITACLENALEQEGLQTMILWLFHCRDIRGGLGERRVFRVCIAHLSWIYPDEIRKVLPLIPEYGRWDDVFSFLGTPLEQDMCELVCKQLIADLKAASLREKPSLLGKWMPSLNASSKQTRELALQMADRLRLSRRDYQAMCSSLREALDVVERYASSNQWEKIRYDTVPNRADQKYSRAFIRHDRERRAEYVDLQRQKKMDRRSSSFEPQKPVDSAADGLYSVLLSDRYAPVRLAWSEEEGAVRKNDGEDVKGQISYATDR